MQNGNRKSGLALVWGIFLGLSTMFMIISFQSGDCRHDPARVWNNLYLVLALIGGLAGLARFRTNRFDVTLESNWCSLSVSGALLLWAMGQALWIGEKLLQRQPEGHASYADFGYSASMVLFTIAAYHLVRMNRRVPLRILGGLFVVIAAAFAGTWQLSVYLHSSAVPTPVTSDTVLDSFVDNFYIDLNVLVVLVVFAIVLGPFGSLPRDYRRTGLLFLCASLMDLVGNMAYVVTTHFQDMDPYCYRDGCWVDWVYAFSMALWASAALTIPLTKAEEIQASATVQPT